MRFIALDPGGTTGVCTYDSETESSIEGFDRFIRLELRGDHHAMLYSLLTQAEWDAIIYERFMYQRRDLDKGVSLVLDSVEYIGVTKLAHQHEDPDWRGLLVEQTPAQAKNFWTDDKLKKLGLWASSPHERDATRHMLYFLCMGKGQELLPEMRDKIYTALKPVQDGSAETSAG